LENYRVGDVVDEVKKAIPTLQTSSPKIEEKLHEAGLLKLDISKAINLLGWKPKLSFEETIRLTVEGYLAELNQQDIYANRVAQIQAYCSK
jgi:CDP-glucose 4,6-dehydratase